MPALALGGLVLAMGACTSAYTVEVVNRTPRTVEARLVEGRGSFGGRVLASARVPADGVAVLGPSEATVGEPVQLIVARPQDMDALPRGVRVRPGHRTAVVEAGDAEAWGGLSVKVE